MVAQFTPILLLTIHFNLFLLFSGLCVILSLFVFVYLPETKSKSLEQIAKMFGDDDKMKAPLLSGSTVE